MTKRLLFGVLLLIALLTGCSSGHDYKVKLTKDLFFQKETKMPFEINVTDKNKAVKGLHITAEFSMANMDHGTTIVKLKEVESGTYSGKVTLPMDGKFEIALTLEKAGKKTEKVIQYLVKKPQGAALMNGKWITNEEVDFYKFLNLLQIAINREAAQKTYKGKQLEEELSYLKSQEKTADDKNQILNQIIRLRSMAMLAEEKGHHATDTAITTELNKNRNQYDTYATAQSMIKEYGEEKFWSQEKEQYKMMVLSRMVQQDLLEQVKKENPNAGDQEVRYLTQEKYEDLLVSQVNSLKILIL